MDSSNVQYYREQLVKYLRSTKHYRNADDIKVQKMVSAVEIDLLAVIQRHQHHDLQTVYEFLDKETLQYLLNETNGGRSLSAQNRQSDGLLREAINYYLGYLGSTKHPLSEKEIKRRKKNPPKQSNHSEQVPNESGNPTLPGLNLDIPETKHTIPEPAEYDKLEGAKHEATVTRYERDRGNRRECIAHYGYVCQVCGMNFEKTYGALGKEFIEVHHLHPVSQGQRAVNPIEDLVPLCSNCHSMIHRQENVSDWKGLREKFLANTQSHQEDAQES